MDILVVKLMYNKIINLAGVYKMNYKCFKCGAEMDKSIESGHTVLQCSKCNNSWVSPTPSFMPGSGGDNPQPRKFKKVVDDDDDDYTPQGRGWTEEDKQRIQEEVVDDDDDDYTPEGRSWTEEDKQRIQEENGFSDEDMANGAWIDF
jgi:ribosomal protein L37AE/L43A